MSDLPTLSGRAAKDLPSSGHRIIVTGAGGWIGLATLELLRNTIGAELFAERVIALGSSERQLQLGSFTVRQRPLAILPTLDHRPTLLLHLAFLTKDRAEWMQEDEYVRANRALSSIVIDSLDAIGAEAVFVASSGAAGFADVPGVSRAMRLYGSLKKADEDAFAGWARERGRRAVIGRIFALSGAHINKHETYALASFINDALAGRPIGIRADIPVYRSYVAIREVMSLVFASLLEKEPGVLRFDTGGERLEMQRIAEIVSDTLGPVPVDRPPLRTDKVDDYVGDDAAYRRLLSTYGIEHLPFNQQVAETAAFLASEGEQVRLTGDESPQLGTAEGPGRPNKRTIA